MTLSREEHSCILIPNRTCQRIGQARVLIALDFDSGSWQLLKRVKKLQGINPHQSSYIDLHFKRSSKWWGYRQEVQDERQDQNFKEMKSSKS